LCMFNSTHALLICGLLRLLCDTAYTEPSAPNETSSSLRFQLAPRYCQRHRRTASVATVDHHTCAGSACSCRSSAPMPTAVQTPDRSGRASPLHVCLLHGPCALSDRWCGEWLHVDCIVVPLCHWAGICVRACQTPSRHCCDCDCTHTTSTQCGPLILLHVGLTFSFDLCASCYALRTVTSVACSRLVQGNNDLA
jgi:hypothetical protein